ncbi:MAG: shikimate dehydrogenase [Candidatus Omnitrophica bacterium]|nr:shikimate dehydrogenase [Candidatus Omnitrophota bacterium]
MNDQPPAIYGIIGNPLTHTLSPLMHNAAFKALKVNAIYKPFPLEEEELNLFIEDLKEADNPIFGLNVTIPYKEKILPMMDGANAFAEKVGAVNTIVINRQRKLFGYNTDGPGFLAHIKEVGFSPEGKRIAILGAGGTTRAILSALALFDERPESIKIYNRTYSKAKELLEDLSCRLDMSLVEVVPTIDDLNIELADCLINTTSVGLKPTDECLVDPEMLHKSLFVYDVIYNPQETALIKCAKEKGAQTANGLGMLFYQGTLSLQHWANTQLDDKIKDVMRRALEQGAKVQ